MNGIFKEAKDLSEVELELANITSEELIDIYNDYIKSLKEFETEGIYLSNKLQACDEINSVRWRVKDPVHLLIKIVRKRKKAISEDDTESRYLNINTSNYKEIITDLVGLRAIYLFKRHWMIVDEFICKNFHVDTEDNVVIYHAPEDELSFYYENKYKKQLNGSELIYIQENKESKYRSTHYIIKANFPHLFKIELQIRSILDEAWGEIDHSIRYPNLQDDPELNRQMTILNGAINGCEELATTYFKGFQERSYDLISEVDSEIKKIKDAESKNVEDSVFKFTDNKLKEIAISSAASKFIKTLGFVDAATEFIDYDAKGHDSEEGVYNTEEREGSGRVEHVTNLSKPEHWSMQFNNTINRKINKANISPDKVLFEKDPDIIQAMGNIIRFANKKRSVNI
ncbi:hypothetical protein Q4Q99_14835, partial [Morganella morganii]